MKLPIERTRTLAAPDNAFTVSPDDWIDDDTLEYTPIRCGGFLTTTEHASWKSPYTSSPYEAPCALYLCRPLSFYKSVAPTASVVELPFLPVGRVLIPFRAAADKKYGREWCWFGVSQQTVEAIRMVLTERGVVFDEAERVKGEQVEARYDKWWTMFQARFDDCKIYDSTGLSRNHAMGLQYVLAQAKADLYAAVAFTVRLTYGGRGVEFDEWKRTPMHVHFTPRIVCVTGPAHTARLPSYNESEEHLLSPDVYSLRSMPSLQDTK